MIPKFDLKDPAGIRSAAAYIKENPRPAQAPWTAELMGFLEWVRASDQATRATLAFQKRLWDDEAVSGTGMGTIAVDAVIADEGFRRWLAEESLKPRAETRAQRVPELEALYKELVARFGAVLPRIPHLKILRTLAALFPSDFTTIADRGTLEVLARRMRGFGDRNRVGNHVYVRERLDEVLGPAGNTPAEQVERLELPWYLYDYTNQDQPGEERVTAPASKPGVEVLAPLPAERRRRGLTAMAGGFKAMLRVLEVVKDGLTREELLDYLRTEYPKLKDVSRRMIINIMRSELGVIKSINNEYTLTERGAAVLESSSADELGGWLLTRVLGVDHVLKRLTNDSAARPEIISMLQQVNPGWSSDFSPNAMINWLVSMGVVSRNQAGVLRLEPLGVEWAERIHWVPESLDPRESVEEAAEPDQAPGVASGAFALPPLSKVVERVVASGIFEPALVEQLHLGLWSHGRRHFAVLAGISGSGKTMLGQKYAEALETMSGDAPTRFHIQPIQPGWYDPSPLLGYLNPLQKDTYQRTEFLTFLMRASLDPARPYLVILDEMNLSHPEQYFAPLLSAMEVKGSKIHLHSEGDVFDGIPESIPYPSNLAIIGTVNMDETTHGLSDKVLDRAFTLEFWDVDLDRYQAWNREGFDDAQAAKARRILTELMKALAPSRLHFGWRVVDDVLNFLSSGMQMSAGSSFDALLDAVIYAKVLPKLRGEDSERFRKSLEEAHVALDGHGLRRCCDRVAELKQELVRSGSARFWR